MSFVSTERHVQFQQKDKNRKDAEHDQEVLIEEHDQSCEDIDAVGIFNNFHTSSNTGLSDATREAVVSTFICFS
jgi:hypothetical protein